MSIDAARDKLSDLVRGVLLGPLEIEETLSSNPADTYLTGILWPRDSTLDAIEDDAGLDAGADDGSQAAEFAIPGYRAIRPCSIGITCTFDVEATVTILLNGTARYVPLVREVVPGSNIETRQQDRAKNSKANKPPRVNYDWLRSPLDYLIEIQPGERRLHWRTQQFIGTDGTCITDPHVAVDIKRRVSGTEVTMTVTLMNLAEKPDEHALWDMADLFQARVEVRANVGKMPAIRARPSTFKSDDEDALTNRLLYRDIKEFAVGHGIAAEWPAPAAERVSSVATTWLPTAIVAGTDPRGHDDLIPLSEQNPSPFSAAALADARHRSDTCAKLRVFVGLYGSWIERELAATIGGFDGVLHDAAEANLKRCEDTLQRLERGVEILDSCDEAWQAFALSNAAMDMQAQFPAKRERARPLVWRPFQLAFMLLVIPSLVKPEEERQARSCADLLWFPTGGGKTEAYLALTAFQIFFRRLTSTERREKGGVDVLMRYTLRLLTVQQFQRATALIVACDHLRREQPEMLGEARITIGLYAGGDATPNRMEDAVSRIADEQSGAKPVSTPRQLLECPVCGGGLPISAYVVPHGTQKMRITCPSDACATRGNPLPVMTVDDVMYAEPPSLLIGTVDKFAQLPRRSDIRVLFGLDSGLRPGLIIQDELHLISGPLGSMAGLYEAAVDYLCTVDGMPPKIIGSTATIGRAARQVRALFDRDVLQFPPPGFDAADSFFAIKDVDGPDRRYVGLASAGRSPKFALQAALAAVSQGIASLLEQGEVTEAEADPYWTCVAYFNSLRELGGAHVLVMDDVPRQMQFLASRLHTAVRKFEDYAKELSGRVSSRDIPQRLMELSQSLGDPDVFAPVPVDMVLASNMISVGVDVPRLGLMVVNGQPKSTAEYIQASSRVGRGLPGLILTLYNFGRPRDLSHFEHFQNYHGALYRSVEATSVTPWAPRARDKAVHAVFVALVRNLGAGMLGDKDAVRFDPTDPAVVDIASYLIHRAGAATGDLEKQDTADDLHDVMRIWARRSKEARATGTRLNYWEKVAPFGNTSPALMYSAEDGLKKGGAGWPTPNSMREVEPSTAFVWKQISRSGGKSVGSE